MTRFKSWIADGLLRGSSEDTEVSAVKLSFSRGLSHGKSRGVEPGKPRWHRAIQGGYVEVWKAEICWVISGI